MIAALAIAITVSRSVEQTNSANSPNASTTISTAGDQLFGSIVGRAGDVNLDGIPDFVIGGSYTPGELWILSGKDGSTLHHLKLPFHEPAASARIDGGVDVDGDGVPDVLIARQPRGVSGTLSFVSGRTGAVLRTIAVRGVEGVHGDWARFVSDFDHDGVADVGVFQPSNGKDTARLSIFSSRSSELLSSFDIQDACSASDSGAIRTIGGFVDCGDVDRDGTPDLAVVLEGCSRRPACVRVYSGAKKNVLWEHASPLGPASYASIVSVGDLDRDGAPELAVSLAGCVDVVSGRKGDALFQITRDEHVDPPTDDLGNGWSLAPLGDIDGDGAPDFAVSEPDTWCGTVRAISGKDKRALWRFRGCDSWHFGYQLAAIGDVDGDSVTDLIVGDCEAESGQPGVARVISGKSGRLLFEFARKGDDVVVTKRVDVQLKSR